MKVCMIATLGGHLAQLELLQPASHGHDAYLVSVSSDHALQAMPGMRRYMVRQILRNPALLLINSIQSLRIILRERPQVVITTGAGDALPTVFLCALLGCVVVLVESFARVSRASLFGRLVRHWCDVVLYQWPELRWDYPTGIQVAPLFQFAEAPHPLQPSPTVLVLTGTHSRGFERLLIAIDNLVEAGVLPARIQAQVGQSTYVPRTFPSFRFTSHERLMGMIESADVVITHDGSASIGEALSRGKRTIVVPRRPNEEASYKSDQQLARHLASLGWVTLVDDMDQLAEAVVSPTHGTIERPRSGAPGAVQTIVDFMRTLRVNGPEASRSSRVSSVGGSLDVVLVSPVNPWTDAPSGIKAYTEALILRLSESGLRVTIVTTGDPPPVLPDNVDSVVVSYRRPSTLGFLAALFLNGARVTHRGDVIHVQRLDHLLPVAFWSRSTPTVVTLHGDAARSIRLRKGPVAALILRVLEEFATRFVDAAIAVDEQTCKTYESWFPRLRGKITTIPIGTEAATFSPRPRHLGSAEPFPASSKLVLFAGRLDHEKNVSLLLDSFSRLTSAVPDAFLVIAGEGRQEGALRKRAQFLGLTNVRFLPTLSRLSLWDLIRRAEVVAIPSLFESGPLIALEAIRIGTPIVSTPVGRIPEILGRWVVGKVARAEPGEFADALREVIERTKAYYSNGLLSAAATLSFDSTLAATLGIYRSVTAGRVGS